MKTILAICFAIIVSSCATTDGLNPTVSKAGFDGATIVDISEHGNQCLELCTTLAAQWSSVDPDLAHLQIETLSYEKFYAINGAKLRINNEVIDLQPEPGLTHFEKDRYSVFYRSAKWFVVPLDVIYQITTANDAWIRINTTDGTVDDAIITSENDSKSYHSLKRFLSKIDEVR